MTGLLVSVRTSEEAELAIAAGVDVIDAKEPRRGALGPVDEATLRDILRATAGRLPVSAALGELLDEASDAGLPTALTYAKRGLAGCASVSDWRRKWQRAFQELPAATAGVAVAYADWRAAQAPRPEEVLSLARDAGCRILLVDTYQKCGPGLLGVWKFAELARYTERVRETAIEIVLAGSLTPRKIEEVLPLEPRYVAVRGAACREGRNGPLDFQKILQLVQTVHGTRPSFVPEDNLTRKD